MKQLFVILLLSIFTSAAFAQGNKDRDHKADFEQYKAKRVSYMTEKMSLTPSEAQKFWPIYNQFDEQRNKLHQDRRDMERRVKDNPESISEKECKVLNEKLVGLFQKEADLMKLYNDRFLAVLPAKKVVLIGPLENEFRFKMIREFRQKEREQAPPRP